MKKIFLIADTHFGHKNIIEYEKRPFSTKYEMDETIIKNWNRKVKAEHYVFVLGDFSFYGKDKTTEILSQLNGKKILIKGNHDRKSNKYYYECGFDEVSEYPMIVDEKYIFSHQPIDNGLLGSFINIHGHVHNHPDYEDYSPQSCCVSCERLNYTPADFDIVKMRIGALSPNKQAEIA